MPKNFVKMVWNWPASPLVSFFILCFSSRRCFPGLQRKSLAFFFTLLILIFLPKLIFYWHRCWRFLLGRWLLTRETVLPPKWVKASSSISQQFFFLGSNQLGLFSPFGPWWLRGVKFGVKCLLISQAGLWVLNPSFQAVGCCMILKVTKMREGRGRTERRICPSSI